MARRSVYVMIAALGAALLAGCNDEEQGRAVHLDKGVYKGAADTRLAPDQVDALLQRSAGQRF
ncbi:hypothetical protein [Azospirillum rugosum]|uniref:Uncharacterized protein n=1 Tax=Azospirillum rugosum TaxID=416170 RepID=A0ABS4SPC3_9PROT|nr:hypothetical protein [Azospirillum rugosum]MBP2294079.1 hypothetical protein [Azospirillum rugosum]MDQ0527532.1 hypothetical protein [Azospirillum rugosum]